MHKIELTYYNSINNNQNNMCKINNDKNSFNKINNLNEIRETITHFQKIHEINKLEIEEIQKILDKKTSKISKKKLSKILKQIGIIRSNNEILLCEPINILIDDAIKSGTTEEQILSIVCQHLDINKLNNIQKEIRLSLNNIISSNIN